MAMVFAGVTNVFAQPDGADHYSDQEFYLVKMMHYTQLQENSTSMKPLEHQLAALGVFGLQNILNFIQTDASGNKTFNFGTGTALSVTDGELSYSSDDYNIEIGVGNANENSDGTIELSWTSTILAGTDTPSNSNFCSCIL